MTQTQPICPARLFDLLDHQAPRSVAWMAARSLRPLVVTVNGTTHAVAANLMRKIAVQSQTLRAIVSAEAERQFPDAKFVSDPDGNLLAIFPTDADAVLWWLMHGEQVAA